MTPTKEQYEKATRLLRTASGGTLEPQDLEWQNARAKADKEFAELIAQFAADEAEAARMALRAEQCNFCDHPKDAHSPTLGCMACLGDCACDEFNKIALSKEDVKTELRAKVMTLETQLAQAKADLDSLSASSNCPCVRRCWRCP